MKFRVLGLFLTMVTTTIAVASDVSLVSTKGHEPVRAEIVKDNVDDFIINVKFLANLGDDPDAATFAIYTTADDPAKCADFRNLSVPYKKPTKYEREFDLSKHPEVIKALKDHSCVVIKNTQK